MRKLWNILIQKHNAKRQSIEIWIPDVSKSDARKLCSWWNEHDLKHQYGTQRVCVHGKPTNFYDVVRWEV